MVVAAQPGSGEFVASTRDRVQRSEETNEKKCKLPFFTVGLEDVTLGGHTRDRRRAHTEYRRKFRLGYVEKKAQPLVVLRASKFAVRLRTVYPAGPSSVEAGRIASFSCNYCAVMFLD